MLRHSTARLRPPLSQKTVILAWRGLLRGDAVTGKCCAGGEMIGSTGCPALAGPRFARPGRGRGCPCFRSAFKGEGSSSRSSSSKETFGGNCCPGMTWATPRLPMVLTRSLGRARAPRPVKGAIRDVETELPPPPKLTVSEKRVTSSPGPRAHVQSLTGAKRGRWLELAGGWLIWDLRVWDRQVKQRRLTGLASCARYIHGRIGRITGAPTATGGIWSA